jgi:tol-pal system protein YbgF
MRIYSRLLLTAFAAAWLIAAPAPTMAQNADLGGLSEDLQRLRNDIKDIQLFIFRGEGAAPSIQQSGVALEASEIGEMAASLEVKFGMVEDQYRTLTGQIEEIAYRIGVVSGRVEKLVSDVDFRLSAIERAQEQALARTVPQFNQPASATNVGQSLSGVPSASTQPGTLGTLSVSALSTDDEALASTPPPAPALPAGTVKEQYNYAFSLLRQQEYTEAERALTAFIEVHPSDPLAGNANYWLAETYYVRGDFQKAAGYFAAGYKNFPDSNKASDNLLKLAMSLANLDQTDQACLTFKELAERYPDAPPSIKQRAAFESQRAGCG